MHLITDFIEHANPEHWVSYMNGNTEVFLNTHDGTKLRYTADDEFREAFPESMDVKITNSCDMGCPWCHENSVPNGEHAYINQPFVDTIHPYTEIAVGGGNVLEHPRLEEFLRHLKHLRCIPSVTLNQRHFLENADYVRRLYREGLVYGIGVSLSDPTDELIRAMGTFETSVLHVINGIITPEQVERLSGHGLRVLVLGYKDIRRGEYYHESNDTAVDRNMAWLGDNLDALFDGFDVVSFDNLALEQLPVRKAIGESQWQRFYMGDDGDHTFYIDMVERQYAQSSTSMERTPIGNKSIDEMFANVNGRKRDEDASRGRVGGAARFGV